jgi:lipopolysaccharide biosynthesis protein/glycosyltransferase involved in cell wall biosynthesis
MVVPSRPLGRPEACNAGLDAVKGDYFCFLDEDDILLPGAIAELVQALRQSTAVAAYGIIERVNGRMAHEVLYDHPFSYGKLFWENYIPNLAVLYRSRLPESGCRFDETLEVFEDWDFLLQVCEKGDLIFRDVKIGLYRNFNSSGVQTENERTAFYKRRVIEKWIQRIPMTRWTEAMKAAGLGQPQVIPVFFAQLFYKGNEDSYCEENSLRLSVHFRRGVHDFVFEQAVEAKAIRFDPLNQPALVRLGGITLMYKGAVLDIPWQIRSNDCCITEEGYLFETGDPQICFEPETKQAFLFDRLKIEIEYVSTGIEAVEKVAANRHVIIEELYAAKKILDQSLSENEKELRERAALIKQQAEAFASLSGELSQSRQEAGQLKRDLDLTKDELRQSEDSLQAQKQATADQEYRSIALEHALRLSGRHLAESENLGRLYKLEIADNQERLQVYREHLGNILQSREYIWSLRILRILRFIHPADIRDNLRYYFRRRKLVRLIKRSSLFDTQYYLVQNPDVASRKMVPEWHFLLYGGAEGRDPSPGFNTTFYLKQYRDVKESGINPLVHYLVYGQREGRKPLPPAESSLPSNHNSIGEQFSLTAASRQYKMVYEQSVENTKRNPGKDFEPESACAGNLNSGVKLIAFYLPQFHPIPENDQWWGKGFTEWVNVTKAIPQFEGHYQPRLPDGLGFYDLRLPEAIQQQVELAKKYGLYGFCFHYYWFGGRRLLEKPLQLFIEHDIDFPFCICWANENWTRRWDGSEEDILISQPHHFENDKEFISDIIPLLMNARYIRVNGRPVVIVYRPGLLEEPAKTLNFWREECERHGVGNPYFVGAQTFGLQDPVPLGFDAAIEFPPHNEFYTKINNRYEILNKAYKGFIYDYREMVDRSIAKPQPDYRLIRTLVPSWDNDARKPGKGHSFTGSSPALYNYWLEELCRQQISRPEAERLVFVNAWNEWAEGAYLEPDRRYGYAYLNATYKALKSAGSLFLTDRFGDRRSKLERRSSVAVVLHVFYWEMFAEMAESIRQLPEPADVYVSLPRMLDGHASSVFDVFPEASVMVVENRGRDVAPFICIFREIADLGYDRILKLHTKRSSHREDGERWREDILSKLLRSHEAVRATAEVFEKSPALGIVGPSEHVVHKSYYWGYNQDLTLKLAGMAGIQADEQTSFHFVAGSMFWFRPAALKAILRLPVSFYDFPEEPIPPDGTLAHAIERLFGLCAISSGYEVKQIDRHGTLSSPGAIDNYGFAEPIREV